MMYGGKVQVKENILTKPKNIINDWMGCTILDLPFIMETMYEERVCDIPLEQINRVASYRKIKTPLRININNNIYFLFHNNYSYE